MPFAEMHNAQKISPHSLYVRMEFVCSYECAPPGVALTCVTAYYLYSSPNSAVPLIAAVQP